MLRWLVVVVLGSTACASGRASTNPPAPGPIATDRAVTGAIATGPSATGPSATAPSDVTPSPGPDDVASGAALSGTWSGTYVYTTRGVGGAPGGPTSVAFFAELEVDHERVHGSVVEPNSFDDDATGELRATLEGVIEPDGTVRLTKRYDGTAGVAHVVEYVGRLDLAATRIEGTWSTSSGSGRFVMKRDRPLPQVAGRSVDVAPSRS